VQTALTDFTGAMATALPINATTGSAWSDSFIGDFPHFGVSASLGATLIPSSALNDVLGVMGLSLDSLGSEASSVLALGVPFPAWVVQARIGGFILPFDIGVKYGTIPESLNVFSGLGDGYVFSYTLAGLDLRYDILNEKKNFIDLSVGGGVYYLAGKIQIPLDGVVNDYTFTAPDSSSHTISFDTPNLYLGWESVSFDLNAQVSKQILFLTPYLGAGLTLGNPAVTSGITATNIYLDGAATDASALSNYFNGLDTSFTNGWVTNSTLTNSVDARVYGGFSFDIFVVHLDLNAMYSFIGQNYGGSLNLRVQL
jgi:hypothetical protein